MSRDLILALMTAIVSLRDHRTPTQCAELALELLESSEEAWAEKQNLDRSIDDLEAAAFRATEVYPPGHAHAGALIVAFEGLERLEELKTALNALNPRIVDDTLESLG